MKRVRIVSEGNGLTAGSVHINDLDTGEIIELVKKAVITLEVGKPSMVELTYMLPSIDVSAEVKEDPNG
jgi:hypothetical protein